MWTPLPLSLTPRFAKTDQVAQRVHALLIYMILDSTKDDLSHSRLVPRDTTSVG